MRSETDKLIQSPVTVILGGNDYEIKPLPVKYSAKWTSDFIKLYVGVLDLEKIESNDPEKMKGTMVNLMVDKPNEMVELFWQYAKDLPRAELEEQATYGEVMDALEQVVELESPLSRPQKLAKIFQSGQPSNL